ncbi:DNA recombination protein RmuC [Sulfitobacter donghicola]|uniref:DNA recombination protein RmuC homolog n=1 Tax=Sulfitobacter donghicola DSW-25 = KCTC 12864 = JCM 14565 TaxID=1300350 RepID=A0A073IKS6_9RHOB|nr:DNA recombination protein RmuC [Sulfitobacter donghicola]KEJ90369.1 DNA recombination protein RmuC [Sulfitobacter donghicola DSW-25 = KCTC 12864 = JCM 14565]KIN67594.1 RmuC domain protein [Sulfitobacter donghicola DSW-25 = KCTC 12864 = JCM 14565]
MIQLGEVQFDLNDPVVLGLAIGIGILCLVLVLLCLVLLRPTRIPAPLSQQLHRLGSGQEQLRGNLQTVSDTQAHAQTQLIQSLETRLATVQLQMQQQLAQMQERTNQSLHGSAQRTTTSLTQLQERLAVIDKAQNNITKLSGDVLSLQDILSNKQTRGAFGEIQLNDIVSKALPSDSYTMQKTLSNGRRADCLIHLPNPPGPIVIDAKFPLEAYEALHRAQSDWELKSAVANMRTSVRKHIRDIAEKYILDGETADGALMFLPSEAVYAELHANFPELVREGFDARVWIVSPTTCMATLNTMRAILKDARMREQAGEIRKTLRLLHRDVELVVERVGKLDTHFRQARDDLEGIGTAAERAGKRAARLDNFDFEEVTGEDMPLPIHKTKGPPS